MQETGGTPPQGTDPAQLDAKPESAKEATKPAERPPSWRAFDPEAALAEATKQAEAERQAEAKREAAAKAAHEADVAEYQQVLAAIQGKSERLQVEVGHSPESLTRLAERHERLQSLDTEHSPELRAALDELALDTELGDAERHLGDLREKLTEYQDKETELRASVGDERYEGIMDQMEQAISQGDVALSAIRDRVQSIQDRVEEHSQPLLAELKEAEGSLAEDAPVNHRELLEQLGQEIRSHADTLDQAAPLLAELGKLQAKLTELEARPTIVEHKESEALKAELGTLQRDVSKELIGYQRNEFAGQRDQGESWRVEAELTRFNQELGRAVVEPSIERVIDGYFAQIGATSAAAQREALPWLRDALQRGLHHRRNALEDGDFRRHLRGEPVAAGGPPDADYERLTLRRQAEAEATVVAVALKELVQGHEAPSGALLAAAQLKFPGNSEAELAGRAAFVQERLAPLLPGLQRLVSADRAQATFLSRAGIHIDYTHEGFVSAWVRDAAQWVSRPGNERYRSWTVQEGRIVLASADHAELQTQIDEAREQTDEEASAQVLQIATLRAEHAQQEYVRGANELDQKAGQLQAQEKEARARVERTSTAATRAYTVLDAKAVSALETLFRARENAKAATKRGLLDRLTDLARRRDRQQESEDADTAFAREFQTRMAEAYRLAYPQRNNPENGVKDPKSMTQESMTLEIQTLQRALDARNRELHRVTDDIIAEKLQPAQRELGQMQENRDKLDQATARWRSFDVAAFRAKESAEEGERSS
ncbi:hypothetical protein HY375_00775 [Candidatus Berkelbacteria bacterium]|nr:hypothetical protein [Candidatus Berkelbacteria bacterium]